MDEKIEQVQRAQKGAMREINEFVGTFHRDFVEYA